jgi:hypothetical protein
MTDPTFTLAASGDLPVAAVALLCLDPALDDKARALVAAAMAGQASHRNHRLAWSANGVSVSVATTRPSEDVYTAILTIEPRDSVPPPPPPVRKIPARNITKAAD